MTISDLLTPDKLWGVLAFAVLAGSLLGSFRAFVFGAGPADYAPDLYPVRGARPADWPSHRRDGTLQSYQAGPHGDREGGRRFGVFSILLVFAVGLAVSSAALFSYNSPWPIGTDLRHLAAGLHCDIARRVDLAPANAGEPGYHRLTDPDGNGVSCETAALTLAPQTTSDRRLSQVALIWP